MVPWVNDDIMANEQPVKKKLRREGEADEPDFIHNPADSSKISELQHPLSSDINRCNVSLNSFNLSISGNPVSPLRTHDQLHNHRTVNEEVNIVWNPNGSVFVNSVNSENVTLNSYNVINTSIEPAPDIYSSAGYSQFNNSATSEEQKLSGHYDQNNANSSENTHQDFYSALPYNNKNEQTSLQKEDNFDVFKNYLIKQCLCAISEATLRKPFEGHQISDSNGTRTANLIEWPTHKTLEFLSKMQLLFDVYLKQNNNGYLCSRIVEICDKIIRNEYNLIEQIISLSNINNKYINYLSAKVLSSFLIIAKTTVNNEWLENIFNFLTMETVDYIKMNFALEIIRRVVEWKDVEIHILEESNLMQDSAGPSTQEPSSTCTTVSYSDSESYDTSAIKGLIIRSLGLIWPELTNRIEYMVTHDESVESQTCILTFLALWESTISVKANLSVIDIKPFYTHLEVFVGLLHNALPPIIWKQLLSLFNEVLCYGSTLALQDMLPDDICQLAHLIVRYVKDYQLLDRLPYRRNAGLTVHRFVGTIPSVEVTQSNLDKTLLQKLVLLVLKSTAITVKEARSDSSDSSVDSNDHDFYQDMQVIERSIRDVLKKVDVFVKNSLDYHPETPFSKVLVQLFNDQDDYMIESMVCTLDITTGISYRNAVFPDLIMMLNPVYSFVEFLNIVGYDNDILLDFLINNETCFLLYLLRFLKYVKRNWGYFLTSCAECSSTPRENELDNTVSVLLRLRKQIKRLVDGNLFPYNIDPVYRLLDSCKRKYEGNDRS